MFGVSQSLRQVSHAKCPTPVSHHGVVLPCSISCTTCIRTMAPTFGGVGICRCSCLISLWVRFVEMIGGATNGTEIGTRAAVVAISPPFVDCWIFKKFLFFSFERL